MSGDEDPDAGLVVTDQPAAADVAFLEDQVFATTIAGSGHDDARELAVLLHDDGALRAGIYGWTWGGCADLQSMWVAPALAGQGLARALMAAAEAEATRRGCHQAVLFTHDATLAGWYARLGYEEVGRVDDYPAGGFACWMRKRLGP